MTDHPVVRVSGGRLAGRRSDAGHLVFHAVPYAAPVTGPARFAAPEPAPHWDGIRPALEPGDTAPAPVRAFPGIDLSPILGTRRPGPDHLTVTVTTPDPGATGLPVLVFVHGGGFVAGTGQAPVLDGGAFAADGVVVVTVNYRLGVTGWLDVPDAPVNRGLLDVIAALGWVRDEIAAFGGDPARVTVAGQSAGAMIVNCLLAVDRADGLFHRAISQSGSADCAHQPAQAALVTASVGRALGLAEGRVRAAALGRLDDAALVAALDGAEPVDHAGNGFRDTSLAASPCKPVIDGRLLVDQPWRSLRDRPVDLLIGWTVDEADLYLVPSGRADSTTEADLLTAARRRHAEPGSVLADLRARHPGASPGRLLSRLVTDAHNHGVDLLADRHAAAAGGGTTHRYRLAWRPGSFGGALGACHGLDVPLVFATADLPALRGGTALLGPAGAPTDLVDGMHRAWVGFVATGTPGWPAGRTRIFDGPAGPVAG